MDKEDSQTLQQARDAIAEANVIYILGFAFDHNNCERLGLPDALNRYANPPKVINYTNYDDLPVVNRAASKLFYDTEHPSDDDVRLHRDPRKGFVFEKSTGNCYRALQKDFGSPESALLAGSSI